MENYSFRPSINEKKNNTNNKKKKNEIDNDNTDKITHFNKYYEDLIKKCREKQMKYNITDLEYPMGNNNRAACVKGTDIYLFGLYDSTNSTYTVALRYDTLTGTY